MFTQQMLKLTSRPLLFFLMTFFILCSLEVTTRKNEKTFFSLQGGSLLKSQIFSLRSRTEILFLGSSRTQDGIDPSLIASHLANKSEEWKNSRGFNAGAAGETLCKMTSIVNEAIEKPGLKLLGIELSDAQLSSEECSPINSPSTPPPAPSNFEDRIQSTLAEKIYLIKYRKSFRLESAIKLPFLIWPDMDDGTKWFGQVAGKYKSYPTPQKGQHWLLHSNAEQFSGIKLLGLLVPGEKQYLSAYKNIAEKAKQNGVRLFFYTPPIRGSYALTACDEVHIRTYLTIAQLNHAPLFISSCEESSPPEYFSDESHLNREGKKIWSTQLGDDIAKSNL